MWKVAAYADDVIKNADHNGTSCIAEDMTIPRAPKESTSNLEDIGKQLEEQREVTAASNVATHIAIQASKVLENDPKRLQTLLEALDKLSAIPEGRRAIEGMLEDEMIWRRFEPC